MSHRFQLVLAAAVTVTLLSIGLARADSSFKRSTWPSRLVKGKLEVRGPGYGGWAKRWVTVDTGVKRYLEVGTTKGPVVVYVKGKAWRGAMLRFNTGAIYNRRSFNKPATIIRPGRYGVLLKVGADCYDYSWNQLRKIDCNTRRYK